MNPWKIIGWVVLGFLLLLMYSCVKVASNISGAGTSSAVAGTSSDPPAVAYTAKVIAFTCENRGNYEIGKATIRNTGSSEIPFAKLFVEFLDSAGTVINTGDTYFSPTSIPPGSIASAEVMERSSGSKSCRPGAMQDGDGNPITYSAQ